MDKKEVIVNVDLKDKAEAASDALCIAARWLGAVGATFVVAMLSDIAGLFTNDRFWYVVGQIFCFLMWLVLCIYWNKYANYQRKRGEFVGWMDACDFIRGRVDEEKNNDKKSNGATEADPSKA